jgi:hypothetical protein
MPLVASGLTLGRYEFAILVLLLGVGWIIAHLIQAYREGLDWSGMWAVALLAAFLFVPAFLFWLNGNF